MDYIYYKDKKGNFGDDLNPWLWPQLFEGKALPEDSLFLGIGSILNQQYKEKIDGINPTARKIVFGTGVRVDHEVPTLKLDDSWDIRFLRGPLSSAYFLNKYPSIADAAYAVRLLPIIKNLLSTPKKFKIGFMPYFKSAPLFDWEMICKQLGFHYISPFSENGVEATLLDIASSEVIITEAMHGGILADALRVPWHRFVLSTPHTEGAVTSEFKWTDWLMSMEMSNQPETSFVKFYTSGKTSDLLKKLSFNTMNSSFFRKKSVQENILENLSKEKVFSLSTDKWISKVDELIEEQISKF